MFSREAQNYIEHRGANEGRVVLHSDLNNFFASVECLKHRSLRSYPVAVCGSIEDRHGIVLAKNNIAKKCGIKTGQVIWQAKQQCPDLVILHPNYDDYLYYSEVVRDIYSTFSDRVEPFGMDEAWLELTGICGVKTISDGVKTANMIRKAVYEKTGLTLSVGVSDNKTFAKLASDYKKPDAVTVFSPEQYPGVISKLPIGDIMFAGRSTQKRLKIFNIETIGDAASHNCEFFKSSLGKNGVGLYHSVCGHDVSPVQIYGADEVIKSIGNSTTPPRDIYGIEDVKVIMFALCDKVAARLRKAGYKATVIQIHVRDTELNVTERQCGMIPSDSTEFISEHALRLFLDNFSPDVKLRSLGVRTSGLIKGEVCYQGSMFDDGAEREKKRSVIDKTVDELRARFGVGIIRRAVLCSDKSVYAARDAKKNVVQPFNTH